MNQQKQTKRINFSFALFVFVLLSGFLFFGNAENVSAADSNTCTCWARNMTGSYGSGTNYDQPTLSTTTETQDACSQTCKDKGGYYRYGIVGNSLPIFNSSNNFGTTVLNATNQTIGNLLEGPLGSVIRGLLIAVLYLVGLLLQVADTLFGWILNIDNFKRVVDSPTIYVIWKQVRDLLNIAFILVLLYSAFCTILQIEKYSYKKLLLNLVIMALLVNFSFPITRFIIDTSNVLMYTITQTLLGTYASSTLGVISGNTGIGQIMHPAEGATITFLIAAIIFSFILAITLLAVGILLVIRMIALALLIIFSPLAFVSTILSDTGGYSTKWWDNLFKYSFFGPIMIFVIYIATQMMGAMSSSQIDFAAMAQKDTISPQTIGIMAYFAMPIVLLWMGIGMAASMSGAAGSAVMSGAQKFMKGAGKKFSGFNAIKKQYDAFAGARKKREEAKAKNRFGGKVGDFANKAQDTVIAGIPGVGGAAKKRLAELEKKKIQEIRDEWKKNGGATDVEIADSLNNHDSAKRKAAAMEAAEKNGFTGLPQYKQALNAIKGDPVYEKLFESKIKDKHVKFAIDEEIDRMGYTTTPDKNTVYEKWVGNMNAEALSKQQKLHEDSAFHDYLWDEVLINNGDTQLIAETAKKLNKKSRQSWKDALLI